MDNKALRRGNALLVFGDRGLHRCHEASETTVAGSAWAPPRSWVAGHGSERRARSSRGR